MVLRHSSPTTPLISCGEVYKMGIDHVFEEPTTKKNRFVISSEQNDDIIGAPMRVVDFNATKPNKNGKGTHPEMTLEDDKGNRFIFVAWTRDIDDCIKEYGKHMKQWNEVTFKIEHGFLKLVPAPLRIPEYSVK